MNFLKKFLYIFIIFLLIPTGVYAENTDITQKPIWKKMVQGKFIPASHFSLKQPVYPSEIWDDDTSLYRFVSVDEPLTDSMYKPEKLVSLSGANIDQAGRVSSVSSVVKPSLEALSADFAKHFNEPLVAISAYRSVEYQQRLWDLGRCNDGAFCAKPGRSEHHLGLAIDFFDATSETQYLSNPRYRAFAEWMYENAHYHGWTQSYKH